MLTSDKAKEQSLKRVDLFEVGLKWIRTLRIGMGKL